MMHLAQSCFGRGRQGVFRGGGIALAKREHDPTVGNLRRGVRFFGQD